MALNVLITMETSLFLPTTARSPGRSRSTRSIRAVIPSSGRRLALSTAPFTTRISTSPTTSTPTSPSDTGADTVAGDTTSTVVASTNTSPLSRKIRQNSADAGERPASRGAHRRRPVLVSST